MTETVVHDEIARLLDSVDGELMSHARVIDALLDLRGAADDLRLVAVIDDSLRNVPGKSAVSTDWWKNQLTAFGLMVDATATN